MPTLLLCLVLFIVELVGAEFYRIGPPFQSKLTPEESQELARICGQTAASQADVENFITNPHLPTDTQFPWAVSISLDGRNKLGGALISPYHVLTAAHGFATFVSYLTKCSFLGYKDIADIRQRDVGYGGRCIRGLRASLPNHPLCPKPDVEFNVIRSVMVDSGFGHGRCIKGHDWAIVELENKVAFTDRVLPICMPYYGMPIQRLLTVAGWGRSYVFNESSPLLHSTTMVHAPDCPRPLTDSMPAHAPDMLCAISTNTSDFWAARTCHGDSGSGMQQRDDDGRIRLLALTSFGTQGCPANELARFTKVENYLGEICRETGVCYTLDGRKTLFAPPPAAAIASLERKFSA